MLEKHFIPKQSDSESPELAEIIRALFSPDNATQKTVLDVKQVIVLARAKAFADLYKIPALDLLCEFLMQLKISQGGRGRKDVIAALQARRQNDDEMDRMGRTRDKLLGRNI